MLKKLLKSKIAMLGTLAFIGAAGYGLSAPDVSCAGDECLNVVSSENTFNILSGQHYLTGTATVDHDPAAQTLTVSLQAVPGFSFTGLHLTVAADHSLTNPAPGGYPYQIGSGCEIDSVDPSKATCSLQYNDPAQVDNFIFKLKTGNGNGPNSWSAGNEWSGAVEDPIYIYLHTVTEGSGTVLNTGTGLEESVTFSGETGFATSPPSDCEDGHVAQEPNGNYPGACEDDHPTTNRWMYYAKFTPACGGGGTACLAQVSKLVAGQHIDTGTITIEENGGNLIVTYSTEGGWVIDGIHLAVADDLSGIPTTKKGSPIPGKFEYHTDSCERNGDTQVVCTVPKPAKEDCTWVLAAHAVVSKDGGSENGGQTETAWGGAGSGGETGWADGIRFPTSTKGKGGWATYLEYKECGCEE